MKYLLILILMLSSCKPVFVITIPDLIGVVAFCLFLSIFAGILAIQTYKQRRKNNKLKIRG